MKPLTNNIALALALIFAASTSSLASDKPVTFDAGVGYQYDSNVSLAGIDASSGEADSLMQLNAGIAAHFGLPANSSLNLAYDYSGSNYQTVTGFDLDLHHLSAEVATDVFGFNASATAESFTAQLDGDGYLDINQVTPALSRLFGSHLYVRGAYTSLSKSYDTLGNRDADGSNMRIDTYWLIDGMNRYVAVGLQKGSEDAVSNEHDFDSLQTMLTVGQKFEVGYMTLKLKAQLRHESRDYLFETESIGERRNDKRLRAGLHLEVPFGDHVSLAGIAEFTDNQSNLDTAQLEKTVYGISLKASF